MGFNGRKSKWPESFTPWIQHERHEEPRQYKFQTPAFQSMIQNKLGIKDNMARARFNYMGDQNMYLDIYTKSAALKASLSVVCLESYTGKDQLLECTGTVMESFDNYSIILTSASLLRSFTVENSLAEDIKIIVHVPGRDPMHGQVEAYNLHFNIAAIRIEIPLPVASFTHLNDAISINSNDLKPEPFHLRPCRSKSHDLIPGDRVIALGRFVVEPYDLMAAPGEFSLDCCCFNDNFDCEELLKATCKITRCGVGGPLINRYAEVIGICFHDYGYTPFLPINIATLWWEHHKKYREPRQPWLGMRATNLHVANLEILGKVIGKFPDVVNGGVLVEKVIKGSAIESVGIKSNDVITQLGGKRVTSFLELFESLWDKVGESVELSVVRPTCDEAFLTFKMVVDEAASDKLYRWPSLKETP